MQGFIHQQTAARPVPSPITVYRPGFAKRASIQTLLQKPLPLDQFEQLTGYQIQQAIALGLPDLSAQERDLLQFYTAFLNIASVKSGKTSVWPSNRITCQLLGISEASLRRYKASLENGGYLIRHYDRRNRPLEKGAIDLAPLLQQVSSLLASVEATFTDQRRYYDEQRQNERETGYQNEDQIGPSIIDAHPLTLERQKQDNSNFSLTVPKIDCSKGKGETISDVALPSEIAGMIALSPKLSAHICLERLDESSVTDVWLQVDKAVVALFADYNTATHTWQRAKQRYGWHAIELLVVCLEDSSVKDGGRFLSYMAHQWRGDMNLKPNLKRIAARQKGKEADGLKNDKLALLQEQMPLLVKAGLSDGAILSWFCDARMTETGSEITVLLPSRFIASRVRADYLGSLQKACSKSVHIDLNKC